MNERINESKMFRIGSCAIAVCMLLAASGCALLEKKAANQQEPFTQESARTVEEEARPAEPEKKTAQKPAAKPAGDKKADLQPEPGPEETVAALPPDTDMGFEKTYTLDESEKRAMDELPATTRTGIILQGEGPYPTSSDLQVAADAALSDGRVLGGISSFDAFPDIPGNDTVGQVFREKNQPGTRIKLFAFHAPGQEYDRVIYGYVVEDTVNDETTGYFDENLDGVFEKVTLKPVIKPAALFAQ